jgi:RNA methyltransferase, TrmH family
MVTRFLSSRYLPSGTRLVGSQPQSSTSNRASAAVIWRWRCGKAVCYLICAPAVLPRGGGAKDIRHLSTRSRLKLVRALQQKKYRDQEGLFIVQGTKLVGELLNSGWRIHSIHATEEAAHALQHPAVEVLPAHEVERLGTLESGNELVAVVHVPERQGNISLANDELALALDGISDPGNLGTILRIADWFGIDNVICTRNSVEVFNPKCVQASMGAIFRVKVHYTELPAELDRLRNVGAIIYLASMEGKDVFDVALKRPAVLVMGSESHGISAEVRMLQAELISIPGAQRSESLNVAMAAAALCMEFSRQFRAG